MVHRCLPGYGESGTNFHKAVDCGQFRGHDRLRASCRLQSSLTRLNNDRNSQLARRIFPYFTMARPREFDLDNTLERAMQAFWAKGYEATSLDDLCSATKLGRSSLYAAFGDKRNLYLSVLDRYESAAVGRILSAVAQSKSPLKGIRIFVDHIIENIVAGPGRRGCFIGNCAAELARMDRPMAARVRQSMARVQQTFRDVLIRARDADELPPDADTDALAMFLMSGIQGLRLVGKANPDRDTLRQIATVMLRCIDR